MTTINLKDFYYWYTQDQFIEVSDEVAEVFLADARYEMAYLDNWESIDFDDKRKAADGLISTIKATSDRVQIEWKI